MITIAISNQKGGVGKTTTSVTVAHGFARLGMRTLLVDLDSQGNVADSLGLGPGHELVRLLNPMFAEPLGMCVVASGRANLDVVRSDKTTTALKLALAGVDFREFVLERALAPIPASPTPHPASPTPHPASPTPHPASPHFASKIGGGGGEWEVCVLDCAPSVDVLHTAALVAADWLVIPTRLDQLAMKGVRDLLVSLADVHRMRRSVCQVAGILPTFYDRVTGESQRQLEHLVEQFGRLVLPPVPLDTVCREASRAGETLFEFAPGCRAMVGVPIPGAAGKGGGRKKLGGYVAVISRLVEVMR